MSAPTEAQCPMCDVAKIELYHIVNVDRLASILSMGYLCSDIYLSESGVSCGTSISYEHIRERRRSICIERYPELTVGNCVPFYFGRHSPMLYRAMKGRNDRYDYTGGQDPIVYLVFNMGHLLAWAEQNAVRWIFTDRNASDHLAQQFYRIEDLDKLSWNVIKSKMWNGVSDIKAAEFLIEHRVPINECLLGVAVRTETVKRQVEQLFSINNIEKPVKLYPTWYF